MHKTDLWTDFLDLYRFIRTLNRFNEANPLILWIEHSVIVVQECQAHDPEALLQGGREHHRHQFTVTSVRLLPIRIVLLGQRILSGLVNG